MSPARASRLACILVLAASAARADYKDEYKQAIAAVDKENWSDAVRLLQKAVGEKPQETGETVLIYGKRFEPYLPQYYLGLALYKTGNCEGAVTAWDASEGQGTIRKKGDQFKTLQKNRDECRTKLAATKPKTPAGPDPGQVSQATQAAEAEIAKAEQAEKAAAALQSDPALAKTWSQDAALGPALDRARQGLLAARTKLDAGKKRPDLQSLAEAKDLAGKALQQLEAVRAAAVQKREEATRRVAAAATPTTAAPRAVATPATTAPAGPPPELVAAAEALFRGKYDVAAERLQPDGWTGRAAVHGFMMRAAARHALYVIGGEKNASLLRNAEDDVRASRKLDPAFAPDSQAFSPRFVAFFKGSR